MPAAIPIAAAVVGAVASRALAPKQRTDPITQELAQEQLLAVREERQLRNVLLPAQLSASGFRPVYDAAGNLTRVERDPEIAEIESELRGRSLKALRGELPVNPSVERELKQGEETLRERLRAQLGPGYETSTPGIEALARYETGARETRYGVQHGELSLAESLQLARTQAAQAGIRGLPGQSGAGFQPYLGALGQQAAYQNALLAGQSASGFGQLAGTLLTAPSSSVFGSWMSSQAGGGSPYALGGGGYSANTTALPSSVYADSSYGAAF